MIAFNSKSSPVPCTIIEGATRYPRPPLIIRTDSTTPSTITGSNTAVSALTVPTNLNSCSVSITESYRPLIADGIGSDSINLEIS